MTLFSGMLLGVLAVVCYMHYWWIPNAEIKVVRKSLVDVEIEVFNRDPFTHDYFKSFTVKPSVVHRMKSPTGWQQGKFNHCRKREIL